MLNQKTLELDIGDTFQLKAEVSPKNASVKNISWRSADSKVATVDEKGLVTAVSKGETTVYAQAGNVEVACSVKILSYTVTFDSQGGSVVMPIENVAKNTSIILPEAPVKTGFVFGGWFTEPEGEGIQFTSLSLVQENITLYARWLKEELEQLSVPMADVADGCYVLKGDKITLSTEVLGTFIYFTMDGSSPTVSSQLYAEPIVINENVTIKAFAKKEGYKDSNIATFSYKVINEDEGTGEVLPGDIPEGGVNAIPKGIWAAGILDKEYTGSNIQQDFRIYDGKNLLDEKKDYTIAYKNNKNAYVLTQEDTKFDEKKAPQIIIKMKGNYRDTHIIYFRIMPLDIGSEDFYSENVTAIYNSKQQMPKPVLDNEGKNLKYGSDFYVKEYENIQSEMNQFVGSPDKDEVYDITLKGKGNYTGERKIEYTIAAKNVAKDNLVKEQILISKVSISKVPDQIYSGNPIFLEGLVNNKGTSILQVKYKKDELKVGKDYDIEYRNNVEIGTATVTIKGLQCTDSDTKYSYVGEKSFTFKITGININKAKIANLNSSYSYTGEEIIPTGYELSYQKDKKSPIVKLNKEEDYIVSLDRNVNAGTATISFVGINGYTGEVKKKIKISPLMITDEEITVNNNETISEIYCKGGAKAEITVTYEGKKLYEDIDYTIKYSNNKKIYTDSSFTVSKPPTITVKGKGNFSGSRNFQFMIIPAKINDGITMIAKDKIENNKKNGFITSFILTDRDGVKLTAGTDYDKNVTYTLIKEKDETGNIIEVSKELTKDSVVAAESTIRITVKGKGNYSNDSIYADYRILKNGFDIGKATLQIEDQIYTGNSILITKQNQFKKDEDFPTGKAYIKIGKLYKPLILNKDIEVISYSKNIEKGTAKVTFKGIGEYGGTKTVSFKIVAKSVKDQW